jgi:plastocyanin
MTGNQFQPRNIDVDAGTSVTWTNDDSSEHTVTSASDKWSFDESVPGGESVEHTFEESGVYDVYCTIHGSADLSGMSMKVGVGDASIESPLGDGGSGDDDGGGYY